MLYKINEIGDGGLALKVPLTAEWLKAECPDLEAKPAREGLSFKGHLQLQDDDVFLNGSLSGALECTCSRCLEVARLPMRFPVRVLFVARPDQRDDEEDENEDGDQDLAYFDGAQIDIGPELREQVLLAVPINPVCRDNCAGLCPVCGVNRNQTACACVGPPALAQSKLGVELQKLGKLKV